MREAHWITLSNQVLPERQFIEQVRRLAAKNLNRATVRGIGDDCAILNIPSDAQLLVTMDLCIEDVHFRRGWHPAESIGHRCLTRGLSDIAAMGGKPLACFLSLAVPEELSQRWVTQFLRGLIQLAERFHVPLAGGDTSTGGKVTADILVLGTVPKGTAVLRSGARPGDRIYVTGDLGSSDFALKRLYAGKKLRPARTSKHFYPVPRVEVGRHLRERGLATAMIDISDGLSVDLGHICQESSVSAIVDAARIPLSRDATLDLALHGGDEYELLFTARESAKVSTKIAGVPVAMIGQIVSSQGQSAMLIRDSSERTTKLASSGWQHFSKK